VASSIEGVKGDFYAAREQVAMHQEQFASFNVTERFCEIWLD
jgi:hypothetical protein